MTASVPLEWEDHGAGGSCGKRNDVVVALIVRRENDVVTWSLRGVNPHGIARSAGTAETVEDANQGAQAAWDAWCGALGLTSS